MRWFVIALCAACSFEHGTGTAFGTDAGTTIQPDGAVDAPPFATGPFGTPMKVAVSSPGRDDDVTLTGDMLEIFFESDREVAMQSDIWTARRANVTEAWSLPMKVAALSTAQYQEGSLEISTDGRTLYFASNRGPSGTMDVYVARRADRGSPWMTPELVTSLSSSTAHDYDAQQWSDTVLFLGSARGPAKGGGDVFRATRASADATWNEPELVPGLDTQLYEGEAFADATGTIWFTGNGAGDDDIWRAEPTGGGKYKMPELVLEICGPDPENDAWLSPDGHTIYFTSVRDGSLDIYMATR
jgi:hypothetical protein